MEDLEGEKLRLKQVDESPSRAAKDAGFDPDFDPHQHREVDKPTNNFETLVHLLKCSLGTGILAMPQAFARAGLINGIISTILIGIIITHCLQILVRSQYELCKRQRVALLTYTESMIVAFETGPSQLRKLARCSGITVDVFLVVYQLGICCVYTVFIAGTLKAIIDPYWEVKVEIHMLIILLPLILANCIRNLKLLAPFSTFANVLTLIGLGIVVYFLASAEKKSTAKLDMWGSLGTYPLFFGTTLFALTAVGVVIALENNMKTPKDFGKPFGVLNIGMTFIVLLYVAIGIIGYIFCVDKCSDTITLDMGRTWMSLVVQIMYAVAIVISYVLQCYVPVEILWKSYMKPRLVAKGRTRLLLWEYGLRIALCLLTFVLAVLVPRLGLFISLFGALCLSVLGMIFPAFLEICTHLPDNFGMFKSLLVKDILLMLIGVFGMCAGTYASLREIVLSFTD